MRRVGAHRNAMQAGKTVRVDWASVTRLAWMNASKSGAGVEEIPAERRGDAKERL
jgi:hypothetical protein